jgi:dihydrodipicolinate synthase/N-acetylneuraminate lyase
MRASCFFWRQGSGGAEVLSRDELGESSRFLKKAAQKLLRTWAGGGETRTVEMVALGHGCSRVSVR